MPKYNSALRTEQAAQTRQRVLVAAAELFSSHGFARTTLARLAEAAGVSVETVQAQGSKRSLLTAAVHQLSFGEAGEDFFAAPQAKATLEAATPAQFCHFGAGMVGDFNAATFRLWRAFSSAAADDPAVDQEFTQLSGFIRDQCRKLVGMLAGRDWLRADVGLGELGDSLWVLISAENYDKTTVRLGWTHEQYRSWLARSVADLLFPHQG